MSKEEEKETRLKYAGQNIHDREYLD